jgi:hypothetical protein
MGKRRIIVTKGAADNIAAIAWYIESLGLIATADKFIDDIYGHFYEMCDDLRSYALCRDPERALLGLKCKNFRKKYMIVFLETESELIICEFISSRTIKW